MRAAVVSGRASRHKQPPPHDPLLEKSAQRVRHRLGPGLSASAGPVRSGEIRLVGVSCGCHLVWPSACKIRPQRRLPLFTRACSHRASVRIGLRRLLLWSTLVVSNHGPGLFVPKTSTGSSRQEHGTPDLGRGVHRCPSASVVGRGGSYSIGYSPAGETSARVAQRRRRRYGRAPVRPR